MRYYRKKLNGSEWERVGVLTALIELVRPRRGWDLRYVRWHIDMLSVPNVISCADAELLILGADGTKPLRGMKNVRHDAYYEELEKMIAEWRRELRRMSPEC